MMLDPDYDLPESVSSSRSQGERYGHPEGE